MLSVSSTAAEKIGKLLLMLSSSHDGEVVSAARAIDRTLKSENADWHALAASICEAPVPETRTQWQPADDDHWRTIAEWCARPEHAEHLNEWSRDFLGNILKSRYQMLTEKQAACLQRIKQTILRRKHNGEGATS